MPLSKSSIFWTIGIVGTTVLIMFLGLQILQSKAGGKPAETIADPSNLPGLQTGDAPWKAELTNLAARLQAIGLPALSAEGSVLHIHQHLDIFVNGQPVPVPALIGINQAAGFISPIHVHDTSGIIHVESPIQQTFTLGQFFDIWGVRLTKDCVGGYCATATSTLKVYANGTLYQGDPRVLSLTEHEEIVVVYGAMPATLPTYTFPSGY